jgi:acyl carrier protein
MDKPNFSMKEIEDNLKEIILRISGVQVSEEMLNEPFSSYMRMDQTMGINLHHSTEREFQLRIPWDVQKARTFKEYAEYVRARLDIGGRFTSEQPA